MNSYLLTRLFYQEMEKTETMQLHCRPHHQALFFRIVQIQNQVGWQVRNIGLPTEHTMFFTCISNYKTYKKCLTDLIAWGLIDELSPAKNQHQARQISLHTAKWAAFFTQASPEQLPTQGQDTAQTSTNADTDASSTQGRSNDQSIAKASPPYKTIKLLNEETSKSLNTETIKEDCFMESTKSVEDDKNSEKNFSAKENTAHHSVNELPPPQEKKKVAPKRKDTSTPLNIETANTRKKEKHDLLFIDSPYADKTLFLDALEGSEYGRANLEYYYEIVKNWSDSKQARKKDWIATVKNWMLRDFKEGKLVTHDASAYVNSQSRETAGQDPFTGLGNAVDLYFERKFGK